MAAVAVDLEAALPRGPLPIQQAPRANDNTDGIVARALPILPATVENMENEGLRHRSNQTSTPPQVGAESPVDTQGTLTPASTQEQQEREDVEAVELTLAKWRKRAMSFGSTLSTLTSFKKHPKHNWLKDERVVQEKETDFPEGYSTLAAFRNSDESFSVYRKFGVCHAIVLSKLEVEITRLETKLLEVERTYEGTERKNELRGDGPAEGGDTTHRDLVQQVHLKLAEYDKLLLRYNQVCALGPAPPRDHKSVLNWVIANKPLDLGYYDFIWHINDFVSVVGSPGGRSKKLNFFERTLGAILMASANSIKNAMKSNAELEKTAGTITNIYSNSRFAAVANAMTVLTAVGSITIPVSIFFLGGMNLVTSVIAIHAFMALFALMLLVATDATLEKVFIGTVSYGALLAAILSSQNQTFKLAGGPQ